MELRGRSDINDTFFAVRIGKYESHNSRKYSARVMPKVAFYGVVRRQDNRTGDVGNALRIFELEAVNSLTRSGSRKVFADKLFYFSIIYRRARCDDIEGCKLTAFGTIVARENIRPIRDEYSIRDGVCKTVDKAVSMGRVLAGTKLAGAVSLFDVCVQTRRFR